jgi:hypothetical protein
MLNTISEFLLKDSYPLQVCLHSIPVVNVIVRFVQNKWSLDTIGTQPLPAQIQDYTLRKSRFDHSIKTAIKIQIAIAISAFALCILIPNSFVLASVCLGFGVGASTSYLLDLFMKNFGSSIVTTVNGQRVHLVGF